MANTMFRDKAILLRRSGLGIKTISKRINVPISTIRYWCKDIILTKQQISALKERQKTQGLKAILEYTEKMRQERLFMQHKLQISGFNEVGRITNRDLFVIGLALYWAEGYKQTITELGFTNSDPRIINIIIKWFKHIYGVCKEDFILRVSINKIHKYRIKDVLNFWSKTTAIPLGQFTKTSLIKAFGKKVYMNKNQYFGTLRIKVRRGKNLKMRILGSIQAIGKSA